MSGILVMIVLGLIIGAVAKFVMPGDDPGGILTLAALAGAIACSRRSPRSA